MNWEDFKELIKELRNRQRELMQFQGGCNKVMIKISVTDENTYGKPFLGAVSFTPHAIDLKTGKVFTYHSSQGYDDWNVKELLEQGEGEE